MGSALFRPVRALLIFTGIDAGYKLFSFLLERPQQQPLNLTQPLAVDTIQRTDRQSRFFPVEQQIGDLLFEDRLQRSAGDIPYATFLFPTGAAHCSSQSASTSVETDLPSIETETTILGTEAVPCLT